MTEHQYVQQSKKTDTIVKKQNTPTKTVPKMQLLSSHPMAIIQRARINPKSLTHADVMQLQSTIGNRAVGKLLTEIGLIPSKPKQAQPVQMQTIPEEEKEPLQGKMVETTQRQEIPEEEEPLQGKFENKSEQKTCPSCSTLPIQREKENRTGMPDNLKAGIENLSGIDMSDVRVHYNSDKPAEVGALAYTQGANIHVAPGQEKHLPHEAWHVVQQMQGRVKPTIHLTGVSMNDDVGLEREADVIGRKAIQSINQPKNLGKLAYTKTAESLIENGVIQHKGGKRGDLEIGYRPGWPGTRMAKYTVHAVYRVNKGPVMGYGKPNHAGVIAQDQESGAGYTWFEKLQINSDYISKFEESVRAEASNFIYTGIGGNCFTPIYRALMVMKKEMIIKGVRRDNLEKVDTLMSQMRSCNLGMGTRVTNWGLIGGVGLAVGGISLLSYLIGIK